MGESDIPAGNVTPLADTKEIPEIFREPSPEQEVLLSVLGLDKSDIRAYVAVVENPHSKTSQIAEVLDRHRRYVSRSLRTLYDAGLIEREQRIFETGGRGYVYSPVASTDVEAHFRSKLRNWLTDACTEIRRIDRRIGSEAETETGPLHCSQGI